MIGIVINSRRIHRGHQMLTNMRNDRQPTPRSMGALRGAGIAALALVSAPLAQAYELAPALRASQFLPPALISGPNHRVAERVENDGFMNHYVIDSRFGRLEVQSTAELRIRIRELDATALMKQAAGSGEFANSAAEGFGDVIEGAKGLVTDPAGSVSGAVSGVSAIFSRGADNLFGDPPSDTEDSRLAGIVGFSKTKRDYAAEFRIDPYSSNPIMQEALDDLAWRGYAGGLGASALLMAVPGGVGVAVSVSGGTDLMNEAYRTLAPSDLRRRNRERLLGIGVDGNVVDLLMRNTVVSPTQQTLLVDALVSMDGVGARQEVVEMAVLTKSDDAARFRQIQAQMYAAFHRRVSPIERFVPVGEVAGARLRDGTLMFLVPVDHLVWTRQVESLVLTLTAKVRSLQGVTGRHLWVGGKVTPLVREKFTAAEWSVREGAERELLGAR